MNRTLFKLGIGVALCMVVFTFASSPKAEAAWYDPDWDYRLPIVLDKNVPDGYQLRITLDDSEQLGGYAQDNFNDLRFTSGTDNNDNLDFWIQSIEGDNAVIWIEQPLSDETDNIIYCYFGNDSAIGVDNGNNTFPWMFDDFTLDRRLDGYWNINDNDVMTFSNGIMTGGSGTYQAWTDTTTAYDNGVWGIKARRTNTSAFYHTYIGDAARTQGDRLATYWVPIVSANCIIGVDRQAVETLFSFNPGSVEGGENDDTVWHNVEVAREDNDDFTMWVDNVQRGYRVGSGSPTDFDSFGLHIQAADVDIDYVYHRMYLDNTARPVYVLGDTELGGGVTVTLSVDNALIDRDQDYATSGAIFATQITAQVEQLAAEENADSLTDNVRLWVEDNSGNVVIDNVGPIENSIVDDNTLSFTFAIYNPSDALGDADLGGFTAYVTATDNNGSFDNWGYGVLFTVSDLTDNSPSQENLPGHIHRIGDNAGRVDHGAITLTAAWIIDNNDGTLPCTISGSSYDNVTAPTDNGNATARFETVELDGITDGAGLNYPYPNIPPGIESVIVDNALIDNHRSDNAITATRIQIVWEDNDNYSDFNADLFMIAVRDVADVLVDNQPPDSITYENENRAILVWVFDAEDNTLADAAMGAWDVHSAAGDSWDNNERWTATMFTVNDMVIPVVFTPTNPYAGFDLTVSGTSSLRSGAASVDNHRIVDSVHGTFWQAAGNSYSENYDITIAAPSTVVPITVTGWEGVLDGQTITSYTVSDNQIFQIIVRFEENYELATWIHNENRPVTIEFLWEGGSVEETLDGYIDNFNIDTGENLIHTIQITDNGLYWRRNVIDVYGGEIVMIIAGDYGTVGGTAVGDVDQFTFFLQDMTALYEPPGGIMSFRQWIGENFAVVHEDFWGADWKMVSWLVTGSRYQVWMEAADAPLRLIGPIDAVNPGEEKTIQVTAFVSEVVEIYDNIYWAAYRVSDNVIRVEYRDNTENTTTAYVAINNYRGTLLQAYQPDNSWFIITYSLANPDAGYSVDIQFTHSTYGQFELSVPIAVVAPAGIGGVSNRFGLPDGVTLAGLGSFIIMMIIGLAFDSTRVPFGMLSMAIVPILCWWLGWLNLPGPFDGAFTATMFIVAAVLVILAWRRGQG